MTCPRCRAEPPIDAEFCPECGVKISVDCWNCHTPNRLADRFCKQCGHGLARRGGSAGRRMRDHAPRHLTAAILRSRASAEGERKVVTILFADVKGSTELLLHLDPEAARRILDPILERMIESVHRYEGTVNQVLGDGIMALFGAPLAHEDHAVRASHAALAMRDSIQSLMRDATEQAARSVDIRVGLNSGEVVVRAIHSDLHMDYSAVGLTTHLAARMEQIAAPNSIYMTETTWRLARRYVAARPLGSREVRGIPAGVSVWELTAMGAADGAPDPGLEGGGRFVGRAPEMGVLEQARQFSESGDVRVIGISGHAGVGKTRLSLEFIERCRRLGAQGWVLRAVPHGRARPFSLVLDFVRQYFAVDPSARGAAMRCAIEHRLSALGAGLDASPFVETLDEVDVVQMARGDTEFRRHALFEAIGKIIRLEGARTFVVLLLEDLHWLDEASELFVESLVDALPGTRAMIVANFRPPYVAGWMQRSYYQQVPLSPLRGSDAASLVDALIGHDPSLATIRSEVLERGQGNPFFLEELVQSLVEAGRLLGAPGAYRASDGEGNIDLPLTVNAVLTSRIDRLPDPAREVLQTASVIGKDFARKVLEQVVDISGDELSSALRILLQGEFILRSVSTDPEMFTFRHPLTQEVSYQSQVKERRVRLHRRTASALKRLYPDRLSELSGLIAYHREAAGDIKGAAGYATRAAMWVSLSDPRQAVVYWTQARQLLERLPDDEAVFDLRRLVSGQLLGLAWRVGMPLDEASAYYRTSVALAIRAGDLRAHALALAAYGRVLAGCGSADEYIRHVEWALAMARERRDRALLPLLQTMAGHAHRLAGFLSPALAATEEALHEAAHVADLGSLLVGFNVPVWMIGVRAQCLTWLARLDEARALLGQMLELVQADRDLSLRMMPRVTYAEIATLEQDAALAWEQRAAAEDLLEKGKSAYLRVYALAITGMAELLGGSAAVAVKALQQALEIARADGAALNFEPRLLCDLSAAELRAGRPTDAHATAQRAAEVSRARANRIIECLAVLRGVSALIEGPPSQRPAVAGMLRHAEALIQRTGAISLLPMFRRCQERAG